MATVVFQAMHYLKKTGKSVVEATLLPAKEILEDVEDFWND